MAPSDVLCMCASVRRAARVLTQLYDASLAPSGIGIAQFDLLATIDAAEGSNRTKLAAALAMDRTTLVRNLKVLERDGLIEPAEGEDRRSRAVRLTGEGRSAFRRAVPLWREVQERVLGELGEDRWTATKAGLAEIEQLVRS